MQVSVYDTYVRTTSGVVMHFDILVPTDVNKEEVYTYGRQYLELKSVNYLQFDTNECRFCHIAQADESVVASIGRQGYHILELENC